MISARYCSSCWNQPKTNEKENKTCSCSYTATYPLLIIVCSSVVIAAFMLLFTSWSFVLTVCCCQYQLTSNDKAVIPAKLLVPAHKRVEQSNVITIQEQQCNILFMKTEQHNYQTGAAQATRRRSLFINSLDKYDYFWKDSNKLLLEL